MIMENPLLQASPYEADTGNLIGRDPRKLTRADFETAGVPLPKGITKAIRAKCLECCVGSEGEVRKCVSTSCARWPLRMGNFPRTLRPQPTRRGPSWPTSASVRAVADDFGTDEAHELDEISDGARDA